MLSRLVSSALSTRTPLVKRVVGACQYASTSTRGTPVGMGVVDVAELRAAWAKELTALKVVREKEGETEWRKQYNKARIAFNQRMNKLPSKQKTRREIEWEKIYQGLQDFKAEHGKKAYLRAYHAARYRFNREAIRKHQAAYYRKPENGEKIRQRSRDWYVNQDKEWMRERQRRYRKLLPLKVRFKIRMYMRQYIRIPRERERRRIYMRNYRELQSKRAADRESSPPTDPSSSSSPSTPSPLEQPPNPRRPRAAGRPILPNPLKTPLPTTDVFLKDHIKELLATGQRFRYAPKPRDSSAE